MSEKNKKWKSEIDANRVEKDIARFSEKESKNPKRSKFPHKSSFPESLYNDNH